MQIGQVKKLELTIPEFSESFLIIKQKTPKKTALNHQGCSTSFLGVIYLINTNVPITISAPTASGT